MGAAQLRRDAVSVVMVLLIYLMHLSCTGAGAATFSSSKMQKLLDVHKHLRKLNKPSLKTIQSPDGDIIDCVHISHQPAFDHPLFKDHKIQMRPSYHPKGLYDDKKMSRETKKSVNSMAQLWHINGKCPDDTIPIRRTKKDDLMRARSVKMFGKKDYVMRASSVKMFGNKTNISIPKHKRSLYSDLIDQNDEDPDIVDQSDPDLDLLSNQSDQDPDQIDQSDPDPDILGNQNDEDPDLVDQSNEDPDLIDQSDPDPDLLNNQSDQDPDLIDQSDDQDPDLVDQNDQDSDSLPYKHEYTTAYVRGKYYGAAASIDVWEPNLQQSDEFSLTQIWVTAGTVQVDENTVEAGWQANPYLFGDNNARLFIYWTNDAYKTTGCYNLICSGFVQTNSDIAVGSSISDFSEYNGSQYDISILIWKDPKDGNWWLRYGDEYLGYWPSSLFSYLRDSATKISWGGEITNSGSNGEHTSTDMGSGHFPKEGYYGKSSYVRNIQVIDSSNNLKAPQEAFRKIVSNSNCYDIEIQQPSDDEQWGHYFYYGGPGRNPDCT